MCQTDTRAQKSRLTLQNVGDEVQVCADILDLVEAGQSLDGNVLVAVHLRNEVQVVAEVFPVEGQTRTCVCGKSDINTNKTKQLY